MTKHRVTLSDVVISGVFAGLLLKDAAAAPDRKVRLLVAWGFAGVIAGLLWHLQFPIIKKIWTSSFVLFTAGLSSLLLALFYYVIDIRNHRNWCRPFIWIGMNSITIYLTKNFIGGFNKVSARLVGGDIKTFFDHHLAKGWGDMMISIVGLLLAFWFVYFLYRRKIFLRL